MRIIATDIANLTDARYFAAWGVEGMAYNIDSSSDSLSSKKLKEVVDWVEGPATMIKMEGLEVPENLGDYKSQIDIQSVIIGPYIDATNLPDFDKIYRICTIEDGWQDNDHLILSFPFSIHNLTDLQIENIKKITAAKEVFLDANFTAADLDKISELGFSGIILKGGEEEKVGFKSYDELDEILEAIFD